ncbi:bifunctional folylpolyglutamate synthase/dihydrofolate synthase [Hippea alviniae]|uniref:bifunctional folylpolyglutamate synthase/dihydrofolate synthase n=1 Tax=Hippea alviniae TaxID=1279027 RepID=UPI0003B67BCB|nr:Mur ligase family protein [Hippea alviniae]
MSEIEAYKKLNDILNSLNPYSMKLGLERVESFLKKIGNPQKAFESVLIGGTNGKGSVCQYLTDAFVDKGYLCGTYTSPHLIQLNERFRINSKEIDYSTLLDYAKFIESVNFEGLTYFEFLTVMAFLIFKDFGIDVAVLEVGMGGEFDATNVVNPMLSILTSVSLDHTEHLGDTLEKIALTKSKIIKKVGVVGKNPKEVIDTIKDSVSVPLYFVDDEYLKEAKALKPDAVNPNNVACFLLACDVLNKHYGIKLNKSSVKKSYWRGRFDVFSVEGKTVIVDGAHNRAGVENLLKLLEGKIDFENSCLIFATLKSKDWKSNISLLADRFKNIKLPMLKYRLAEKPESIKEFLENSSYKTSVEIFESVNQALESALDSNFKSVVIAGSLYLVGEILACNLNLES